MQDMGRQSHGPANGATYPRQLGSLPYRSPSGQAYRLEHWAILEAIRRWYVCRDGLYATDGGFLAPSIADAAGCGSAELAKQLVELLENGLSGQVLDGPARPSRAFLEAAAARAETTAKISKAFLEAADIEAATPITVGAPVVRKGRPTLILRPYRDVEMLVVQYQELRDAPWLIERDGRFLRHDEVCPGAVAFRDCVDARHTGTAAVFATPYEAQEAALALVEAERRGPLVRRLREWADQLERGEISADCSTFEPDDDLTWKVTFRIRPSPMDWRPSK
jgi:hypothetical protein